MPHYSVTSVTDILGKIALAIGFWLWIYSLAFLT